MSIRDRIASLFKSRYVAALEAEVERLRNEVRAWQNLCLHRDGLPELNQAPREFPKLKHRTLPSSYLRGAQRMTNNPPKPEEKPQ